MLPDFGGHAFLNKVANYYGPTATTPGVNIEESVKFVINDSRIKKALSKDANSVEKSLLLEIILNELEKAEIPKVTYIGLPKKDY